MFSKLRVDNIEVVQGPEPKAEIKIRNTSLDSGYSKVDAYIVLYDKNDNRVAFSKTIIDRIDASESKVINFTWPESFKTEAVKTEMLFTLRPRD